MRRIKVIISTFGPLHLIKSAEALSQLVDVKVIQGWIPNAITRWLVPIISKIIGRDLSKTIVKRSPATLKGKNKSLALPEFYLWFCRYILKLNSANIAFQSATMFGRLSHRYICDADVFHVRSSSGLGQAIEKAKAQGMKVLVDHSIAHTVFIDQQLRDEYLKNNEKFNLGLDSVFWQGVLSDCAKADRLLVNSTFVKDTFVEQGYDASRISVAYLGVRQDFFALKKNYTTAKTFKILFTGSFGFRKGAEYLLKALQKLDNEGFPYEMIVLGSYQGASALINKYRAKHIRFEGHIPQDALKQYLAESDVYLFPSLAEGCASSGMEAMAAGLPVIATKESGLPIEDNTNGILIPSKDAVVIVDAVVKLSQNKTLREQIGTHAARTISSNYTWEKYAQNVNAIYTNLLKK